MEPPTVLFLHLLTFCIIRGWKFEEILRRKYPFLSFSDSFHSRIVTVLMNRFYTRLPNMEGEYDVMIRPREARERFYKAWRWQAQGSQYNTPSISDYFAVCCIENRDKSRNKTDRKSHPDRNLFSFSLPYGTKHFREEDKERRKTPSVRVWSVIC